jgi:glycerol-3-phosphate dehydrogenase
LLSPLAAGPQKHNAEIHVLKHPIMKKRTHYPVLIIGAGINGCGTFRDLCLQGVDCLLIDKGDVCSGASAAPSRLIHGGIKYLETREYRLVRESAMERNRLLRNAPHFVKPLETVFPSRSWLAGLLPAALGMLGFKTAIKERGTVLIELGLMLYDFYNRKVKALPDHSYFSGSKLRSEYPDLAPDLHAAGAYYEARVTHAERLGLELVLDGIAANPNSVLRTYTQISGQPEGKALTLHDSITGENFDVAADIIINAGGAWIDKVNSSLGISSIHMGGSKGSHLIVNHPKLLQALKGRMMYFGCSDGRFNLIYPFFGNVLVGSTDLAQKDPDTVFCSSEETDYLLSVVSEIFPTIKLTRDDVILTYCGVRPLPRSEGIDIGAVSRDHAIGRDILPDTQIPVLSLIGGKWTTFRAFSEQTCDAVLALLGESRKVSTENLAIGGGRDFAKIDTSVPQKLVERYGSTAREVTAFSSTMTNRPLTSLPSYGTGEIAYICKTENVRRLADLLLRRTAITMEGLLTPAVIAETAKIAAGVLGWDKAWTDSEIAYAQAEIRAFLRLHEQISYSSDCHFHREGQSALGQHQSQRTSANVN